MNELISPEPPKMEEETGSNVKRFLTSRGLLIMKEFRHINDVRTEYQGKIEISTAIISSMETSTSPSRVNYGIKIEVYDLDGSVRGSAFLDFEEFDEVIAALEFIKSLSEKMLNEKRDYTEVNFITKDEIKFGFYQSEGKQMAFMNVDNYGETTFLSIRMLDFIRQNIEFSKNYLVGRGAGA